MNESANLSEADEMDNDENEKLKREKLGVMLSANKKGPVNIDPKLLYDAHSDQYTFVEVLFIPYVDDNEVCLTYHFPVSNYPKVTFSTFIEEEKILLEMNKCFFLFSRNGTYL